MQNVKHSIGLALGAVPDGVGSRCAVCGDSPFSSERPSSDVFGPGFVDFDLLADAAAEMTCAGCALMLGGKPSRENPPLRMGHFAVIAGVMERADGERMVEVLRGLEGVEAVGWAVSRQKHASLRCGPCGAGVLLVGCDHGTIDWRPARDARLLDAVSALRAVFRAEDVAAGSYAPHQIQALGVDVWKAAEAVVSAYRPSLHLDMATALVRRPLVETKEALNVAIPQEYRAAAELLAPLTQACALRTEDPIRFWSEILPRRLASAASAATITEWLSYLSEALRVQTFRPEVVGVLETVDGMSDTEAQAILGVLRRDHRLVITVVRMLKKEEEA